MALVGSFLTSCSIFGQYYEVRSRVPNNQGMGHAGSRLWTLRPMQQPTFSRILRRFLVLPSNCQSWICSAWTRHQCKRWKAGASFSSTRTRQMSILPPPWTACKLLLCLWRMSWCIRCGLYPHGHAWKKQRHNQAGKKVFTQVGITLDSDIAQVAVHVCCGCVYHIKSSMGYRTRPTSKAGLSGSSKQCFFLKVLYREIDRGAPRMLRQLCW